MITLFGISISWLEIAANVITAAGIFMAGRNSIHTWWLGIIGCSLFVILFYQNQLYADVTLQFFFIASSVAGWFRWSRHASGEERPVTHARVQSLGLALIGGLIVAAAYGALLHRFTDAYAPYVDSAVLVGSVIAQLLMMERKVENWPVWLIANSVAVPLYASRGIYLTAFLYGIYWVNAFVSWRVWWKLARA
jgi:nicotinamide mononucleotide transporter